MKLRSTTVTALLGLALAAGGGLAPALAAPAGAAPAKAPAKAQTPSISATVNDNVRVVGQRVRIHGRVLPNPGGGKVTLQVRYENRHSWKTIAHDGLNGRGNYTFRDKIGSLRDRRYRVVLPAAGNRSGARAKTSKITVYGWRDLSSIAPVRNAGLQNATSLDINAVAFPKSVRSYPYAQVPVSADYNLNRGCLALRGVVGLDDISASGGTAAISVATDGTTAYAGTFGLTQSAPVSVNLTGVFRLTLAATLTGGGVAAYGSPQVLCTF